MSLRNKIIEYLKVEYPRIVHKGELGRKAVVEWNFENENCGRRCRELEDEGLIKRFEDDKGRAMYQWIQTGGVPRVETPKEADVLDDRLKELLKRVPKTWDNAKVIGEITDAIKSRFEWKQKSVLDLYDKKF